jgi:N-formylglutamate amidohydrolase
MPDALPPKRKGRGRLRVSQGGSILSRAQTRKRFWLFPQSRYTFMGNRRSITLQQALTEAYDLRRPLRQTTPVIFSSPHSGRDYTADFLRSAVLDQQAIRSSEDAFVDRLFDMAPEMGAPFLSARVPRAFIDLNRAADELDPAVIEGIARAPHNPRVSSGLGVIPRVVAGGRSIYRGKLSLAEAEDRIARFWHPYHSTLKSVMDTTWDSFGQSILIDCHSMPHEAIEAHARPGQPKPEVVLGDRFGAAAGREVIEQVEAAFAAAGFRVARNAPFAGAYIAQAYGRPSRGYHVVQVEIDRALYMNEARIVPGPGFEAFRTVMAGVVTELAMIGRRCLPLAAE